MAHQLKFWGVKGSCPGAKPAEYRYAVNTSCVELSSSDELVILDAGSGIVFLSQEERDFKQYSQIHLFITHYHYDHMIGIPFCKLFYQKDLTIHIYGPVSELGGPKEAFEALFNPLFLPMPISTLSANMIFHPLHTHDFVSLKNGYVKTLSTDHPGGNLAYTVSFCGRLFAYLTDLGHSDALHDQLVRFCEDASWIYYDANFTESEYNHPQYEGWGHSTHQKGLKLFNDANADTLLLGHHAIHRSDRELMNIDESLRNSRIRMVRDGDAYYW